MNPGLWDQTFGPAVGSPDFLERAERVQSSSDPDKATQQTVEIMCGHICKAAADPVVIRCAWDACERFRGGPLYWRSGRSDWSTEPSAVAESCWWWAKHFLRFVHHSKLILAWLNETDQLQLLIAPDVLVRMREMQGDCAIYTMLICAFLSAMQIRWDIVTLACNRQQPTIFSHVFPRAILPDGRRISLDASHGKYPGWEVPERDQLRRQVFDMNGEPTTDIAQFGGLHGYQPAAPWGWGVAGLGDDTTYPDLTSQVQALTDAGVDPTLAYNMAVSSMGTAETGAGAMPAVSQGTVTVPSQGSADWANAVTALGKMGFTLAEINALQEGTVVNPNGQIVRQATGYPVTTGGPSSQATALGTPTTSSLMTWGILAVALVVVIGAVKK